MSKAIRTDVMAKTCPGNNQSKIAKSLTSNVSCIYISYKIISVNTVEEKGCFKIDCKT